MIYIHIPFCKSFCSYCGFYSETVGRSDDGKFFSYAELVAEEAVRRRDEILKTLETDTLYIGGGTPSVLPLSCLKTMLDALPYGPYEEFTVEVNPDDITEKGVSYVQELKSLGVNRISMGIQSFDNCVLRKMHRRHDAAGAKQAFRILREAGMDNIGIDLIFGISGMSDDTWDKSLYEALHLGDSCGGPPRHVSAYQLSVENGSLLEKQIEKGIYKEASDEDCRRQYAILCDRMAEAGYRHYEISNFAFPGYEARHNGAYWRGVPYVGLGAGAHSFDGGTVRSWNAEMGTDCRYEPEYESLSDEDVRVERIMLALRTSEGIDGAWLRKNAVPGSVGRLVEEGALCETGDNIRIPENRFFVSDEIIRELI